ncbi:MAG: gamma-glutamylcyclotransferase family protein [Gemmatimonadota bacterium]
MTGLLLYGSLMDPDELAGYCRRDHPMSPVRVRGFRRSFCQEPSWRNDEAIERGVLTVRPSAADWFNAILVYGWEADVLARLDHRERGYVRRSVPTSSVEPYQSEADLEAAGEAHVYTGREELRNESLRPNAEYLKLCSGAAARWGADFLDDFLSTTYVGRVPLRDFDIQTRRTGA